MKKCKLFVDKIIAIWYNKSDPEEGNSTKGDEENEV